MIRWREDKVRHDNREANYTAVMKGRAKQITNVRI